MWKPLGLFAQGTIFESAFCIPLEKALSAGGGWDNQFFWQPLRVWRGIIGYSGI